MCIRDSISTFANCYGITLGGSQITEENVDGGSNTIGGGTVEAELDIETVLSLAPQANIKVYEGNQSIYDVESQIVSDDTAKVVSISWGACEADFGASYQQSENTLLEEAAVDGQTVFAAAGDDGSEACNVNGESGADTGSVPGAQALNPTNGTLYVCLLYTSLADPRRLLQAAFASLWSRDISLADKLRAVRLFAHCGLGSAQSILSRRCLLYTSRCV